MPKTETNLNSLILRAYTEWLDNQPDHVKTEMDYKELCEWFGKEAGNLVKYNYET